MESKRPQPRGALTHASHNAADYGAGGGGGRGRGRGCCRAQWDGGGYGSGSGRGSGSRGSGRGRQGAWTGRCAGLACQEADRRAIPSSDAGEIVPSSDGVGARVVQQRWVNLRCAGVKGADLAAPQWRLADVADPPCRGAAGQPGMGACVWRACVQGRPGSTMRSGSRAEEPAAFRHSGT